MAKDPLQVAQQQIAEHRAAIARLEQFVEMYVALSGGSLPKAAAPPAAPRAAIDPVQRPIFAAVPVFASTKAIIDTTVEVLRENRGALPALDIYERLLERGLVISGNKPRANMTAKFSTRKDLLRYTEATGRWSLVEWESASPWLGASGGPAQQQEEEGV